jgi:hypothetical protein
MHSTKVKIMFKHIFWHRCFGISGEFLVITVMTKKTKVLKMKIFYVYVLVRNIMYYSVHPVEITTEVDVPNLIKYIYQIIHRFKYLKPATVSLKGGTTVHSLKWLAVD